MIEITPIIAVAAVVEDLRTAELYFLSFASTSIPWSVLGAFIHIIMLVRFQPHLFLLLFNVSN